MQNSGGNVFTMTVTVSCGCIGSAARLPSAPILSPLHPLLCPHAHLHAPSRATPPAPPLQQPTTMVAVGTGDDAALPAQAEGAGPALPCFPLSIPGHLSPRPSASVRPAPWQIRLVPLCRLFRRPPTRPSAPRPASAWQIRLVLLCRLVRRASTPSCAASPQAGQPGKNAQHNSKQVKSPFDQGIGGECCRASPRKGRRPADAEGPGPCHPGLG